MQLCGAALMVRDLRPPLFLSDIQPPQYHTFIYISRNRFGLWFQNMPPKQRLQRTAYRNRSPVKMSPPKMPQPLKKRSTWRKVGKLLTFLESNEGQANARGSQPQSQLMNLPREIKDCIWQECIGRRNIIMDISRPEGLRQNTHLCQWKQLSHRGLLSLPLSCRQGYVSQTVYEKFDTG